MFKKMCIIIFIVGLTFILLNCSAGSRMMIKDQKNLQKFDKAYNKYSRKNKLDKKKGKLLKMFTKIVQPNKAEVAAIINIIFPVDTWLNEKVKYNFSYTNKIEPNDIRDIRESIYQKDIRNVSALDIRGLEVINDNFNPEQKVDKLRLAMIIEDLLVIYGLETDKTQYVEMNSMFKDIKSNQYGYNSAVTAVKYGLLNAKYDNTFGVNDYVTGNKIVSIFNKIAKIKRSL